MNSLLALRLTNHYLDQPRSSSVHELVAHLGAVQAQDYPAARWAVGLRLSGATAASIDSAYSKGEILRTHVLRPTWHLVAPADIRWMLALTAPRIKASMASYARSLGITEALVARSNMAISRALRDGASLTRGELGSAIRAAVVEVPNAGFLAHLLAYAELDALICSGVMRGKQHTYALLDARVAAFPAKSRDEALRELTWRYFNSHGPALAQDCAWWAGLPVSDVKRGLALNADRLDQDTIDDRTYWFADLASPAAQHAVHLLPNFDEYTVAYRWRDLYYDRQRNYTGNPRMDVPFGNIILFQGQVSGRWTRIGKTLEPQWSIDAPTTALRGVVCARQRYLDFHVSA